MEEIMSYIELNKKKFQEEVKNYDGLVVIDFWAQWCNPCKMFAPIFEKISKNYEENDNIKFAKVDIDKAKDLAAEYNIMSIPTIMFIKDGEVEEKKVGVIEEKDLKNMIDEKI